MTTFTIKTRIQCGERTCAGSPGDFCRQLGTKNFGTKSYCCFFNADLSEEDGWVQRCSQYLKAESDSKL